MNHYCCFKVSSELIVGESIKLIHFGVNGKRKGMKCDDSKCVFTTDSNNGEIMKTEIISPVIPDIEPPKWRKLMISVPISLNINR